MKGTKYKSNGGGMMKGTKYKANGGGMMKGTKARPMGGAMGSPKVFSKGGAAYQSEMQANPGMSNMPKSVKLSLGGDIAKIKSTKGKSRGGGMMKGTKYSAKGGKR
jgi:hypothetical protein|tara:strand:+ start:1202 stop:1519 length:318 start_codon:yes stop_codon:yes gene_type:complete